MLRKRVQVGICVKDVARHRQHNLVVTVSPFLFSFFSSFFLNLFLESANNNVARQHNLVVTGGILLGKWLNRHATIIHVGLA